MAKTKGIEKNLLIAGFAGGPYGDAQHGVSIRGAAYAERVPLHPNRIPPATRIFFLAVFTYVPTW